jgi:3-methylcrotonyl-CoA carboxylase alpha subunit
MFASVLVANRGEIAVRILRTARRLGMRTIAIFSDADRNGVHVGEADEAHHIGASEPRLSYLNGSRIIEAGLAAKAEAIHPGYGFLSENADFAQACQRSGIVFVGPSPDAIRLMGLKDEAKEVANRAGVPVVPGYRGSDQSPSRLVREASVIGYPVMIKAVAGGGGRGMRIVDDPGDFPAALDACRREAEGAFGNNNVLLERFFQSARHVEVQLIADNHGKIVHLFERDCSIQRRYQKIIEEAPAYQIPDEVRSKIHHAAVGIARQVGYRNAGTVEFLYDEQTGRFFFMEMNTRLQVEHPVTEMITGLDLVELQLRVAAGEKLPVEQNDVAAHGHAVEARIYAEDPTQSFLPQTGKVHDVIWPNQADIRIEAGVARGSQISPFYDSMIAKVIAWGPSRNQAIANLQQALRDTFIVGVKTNKGFLMSILSSKEFSARAPHTSFLNDFVAIGRKLSDLLAAGCVCWLHAHSDGSTPPWAVPWGWVLGGAVRRERRTVYMQSRVIDLAVSYEGTALAITVDGENHRVEMISSDKQTLHFLLDGHPTSGRFHRSGTQVFVDVDGYHFSFSEPDYSETATDKTGEGTVRAPMPGRVLKLDASNGMRVRAGDRLLVLEAMKMEHALRAPVAGLVKEISVAEGQQVREGDFLCAIGAEAG